MAALVISSGLSTSAPFNGNLNLNGGMNVICGEGAFTTSATTATIPPKGGGRVAFALFTPKTAGVVGLSYAVASDGTITVTRTDTTSGGVIAFLIAYN